MWLPWKVNFYRMMRSLKFLMFFGSRRTLSSTVWSCRETRDTSLIWLGSLYEENITTTHSAYKVVDFSPSLSLSRSWSAAWSWSKFTKSSSTHSPETLLKGGNGKWNCLCINQYIFQGWKKLCNYNCTWGNQAVFEPENSAWGPKWPLQPIFWGQIFQERANVPVSL